MNINQNTKEIKIDDSKQLDNSQTNTDTINSLFVIAETLSAAKKVDKNYAELKLEKKQSKKETHKKMIERTLRKSAAYL